MKVVILAGGYGTRLSEETDIRPKPLVEIGGRPILWHIMKIYERAGVRDFIICLGYRGALIKEYFFNYALRESDVTIDLRSGLTIVNDRWAEILGYRAAEGDWLVNLKKVRRPLEQFATEVK